ncbi:MAG: acetyl-CoA C-acyltransferase [Gammaproteobacteria bacterium]|nr:acetyl-CoA C-acyltransferase [Gammaproteobacteria bacterium]NNF61619.1 acetyl-CoA C-acyltransferase [Gammaproteobacteria bacterium]NNM21115.1 acetyl-CoA C-acyltransferase [Gammaproteobacteria bacterium]
MSDDAIVIASAKRTPIGAFQGALSTVPAPRLGATAIKAALDQCHVTADEVSEVIMGCVLPAGVGQAPARQAALAAGLPNSIGCTTINKVCGSGMKAVALAHDLIRAGSADIVVAGGMESMSLAPYLLPKARAGMRMGHQQALDHMFYDGLQNPYDGEMMGTFAEATAERYKFSREQQDEFATRSVKRACQAIESGAFRNEIAAVTVSSRRGDTIVDTDEEPGRADIGKIPELRPAFRSDGTVTAASSSSISDGAAALVIMSADNARQRGLQPLATIAGYCNHAQAPEWFTTAPQQSIAALYEKLNWAPGSIDMYEINEAFAVVTMSAMHDLGLGADRVNVNGGACALGHPIGATGARIITTLAHTMQQRHAGQGIASLCIGGGEALAMGITRG